MLDSGNRMLALGFWCRRCALAIAAVLLVIPASAQDPVDPTFTDYEREVREHLAGMLAGGGFDPARDILALTVNRWPHGYAYERDPLHDPEWPKGQAPHEIGRQRFGRIAIASSDAGASAYVDAAIEQAHRAVAELVQSSSS